MGARNALVLLLLIAVTQSSDAHGVSTSTRGACLCGAVTFAIAPPYRWFAHCHCSMCRKHHGSLFGTGLGVARERFEWLERQR